MPIDEPLLTGGVDVLRGHTCGDARLWMLPDRQSLDRDHNPVATSQQSQEERPGYPGLVQRVDCRLPVLRRRHRGGRSGSHSFCRLGHHGTIDFNDLVRFPTNFILAISAQDLVDAPGSSVLDASHAPDAALPADINELQSAKLLRAQGEDDREALV